MFGVCGARAHSTHSSFTVSNQEVSSVVSVELQILFGVVTTERTIIPRFVDVRRVLERECVQLVGEILEELLRGRRERRVVSVLHQCRAGVVLHLVRVVRVARVERTVGVCELRRFDNEGIFVVSVRDVQWVRVMTDLLKIQWLDEIGIGAARR